jgi:hypothetical protein
MKTFNEPGRGRKQCPECNKYVAARSHSCVCGRNFVNGETTEIRLQEEQDEWKDPSFDYIPYALALCFGKGRLVRTPSGQCPIKLVGMNQESVNNFCLNIISYGSQQGILYMPQAIKYFIRQQYDVNSRKYERFCELVDNWVEELITRENEDVDSRATESIIY